MFAPPVLPEADEGLVGVALQNAKQAAATFCRSLPHSEPDISQVLQTLLAAYPKRQQLRVLRKLFTLPAARPCPEPSRPHNGPTLLLHICTKRGTWKRPVELETPLLLPPAELQARILAATLPAGLRLENGHKSQLNQVLSQVTLDAHVLDAAHCDEEQELKKVGCTSTI